MNKLPMLAAIAFPLASCLAADVQFSEGPRPAKMGDRMGISFAVSRPTDVEVAVLDAAGQVVRHLAAGVLGGDNPPPSPLRPGLRQQIVWDGKDDDGLGARNGPHAFRVRAGMRGRFDRFLLYEPDAMPHVSALAPGPNGTLYVFYQDATANGNQGGHKVRIIDRQGKFVRQILPFPADSPYEKVQATGAFRDNDGNLVPHLHNWHSLSFYPDTVLARGRSASPFQCPVVDARGRLYWIITGGRLCAIEADGRIPYDTFLSPPLFPDLPNPAGRPALALSSDGRHLYAAGIGDGRYDDIKPVPCVYRIDVATRRCEAFLGESVPGAKEKGLFVGPRGVAAANGLLYVADPEANRVAVFNEADRSCVGEIRVTLPHVVQVHPKTNAVYVCSYIPEEKPRGDGKCRIKDANLLKYASYKDARPAYQIALPATGLSPNGGTHRIALDTGEKGDSPHLCEAGHRPEVGRGPFRQMGTVPLFPLIWTPGLPYARSGAHLGCYRDTGERFEAVEVPEPKGPWGEGPRDLLVDRRRNDVYVKVSGEQWFQFDDATAEMRRLVKFPENDGGPYSGAHGANLGVDLAGNYITHCWGEGRGLMRWSRDLRPLNWDGLGTHRTEWGGMMTFQLRYMALLGNDIYLIKRTDGPHHLEVYDQGLHVKRRVVWNVRRGSVPRVDAQGNIYITAPLRPADRDLPEFFGEKGDSPHLPERPATKLRSVPGFAQMGTVPFFPDYFRDIGEGHYWYAYMAGAIVKFPPQGGAFYWVESEREKNDTSGLPEAITSQPRQKYRYLAGGRYPHKLAEVQGAAWVHCGYAPYSETYSVGTPACMCEGAGFDVDAFGRVFFTNLFRFRVEVIDNNHNAVTHFGQYGNQDSGPDGRIKTPEIPLAWPTYVAVSDNYAYVNDTINLRVLRVKLEYGAERTCMVP